MSFLAPTTTGYHERDADDLEDSCDAHGAY